MGDALVDTNVLIVGSAAVAPGYRDVPVDAAAIARVFAWLIAFRDDPNEHLVLDEAWKIWDEYHNKLNPQHFGLHVLHAKLAAALRTVPVAYDVDGFAVVPPALAPIDNSDKKFVAAALTDPANIRIVNATDSDWQEHVALLRAHAIHVEEILHP